MEQLETTLDNLSTKNGNLFAQMIEEKLVPVLNELKDIKQDSGAAVVQQAVEQLKESMTEMLQQFKSSLGEESKAEMELLTNRLAEVSMALLSVPEQIEKVNEGVQRNMDALSTSLTDDLQRSRQQQVSATRSMTEAFEQTTGSVATMLQNLQGELEQAMGAQVALADRVRQMMSELQTQLNEISNERVQLRESVRGVNASLGSLAQVADGFDRTSTRLAGSSQQLTTFSERLQTASQRMMDQSQELNQAQREAVAETADALQKHREGFEEIQRSLDGIFSGVEAGLTKYQDTTSTSLSNYLSKFSSSYAAAQSRTDTQLSNLNEILEELTEVLEYAKVK